MATLAHISTLTLSICAIINHATILMTGKSTIFSNNTINITIDTQFNLVYIELNISIPSPVTWNGFGFDSTSMLGTYAIFVDYSFPGQNLLVLEATLGDHSLGNLYAVPEIIVTSDSNDGITRTVQIQRAINGTYSFPTFPTTFNMISAIGQQSDIRGCDGPRRSNCQHIAITGRNIKTITLKTPTSSPTNEPTFEPTFEPTSEPSLEPTSSPTFDPTIEPTQYPTKHPSNIPSISPTHSPILSPAKQSTLYPSVPPSHSPITIETTSSPTKQPTGLPTNEPATTSYPSVLSSSSPITMHTSSTLFPTLSTTLRPTAIPSLHPTLTPTLNPTTVPSADPSLYPTLQPSYTLDPFTWDCDETAQCRQHSITCGVTNATYCNLQCTSPLSCEYTIFSCPHEADCNILCAADKACDALVVIGGINTNINVQCYGDSSCITANIHGIDSNHLNVTCSGWQSCNGMTLRCPSNCKIAAIGDELVADKLKLYAENSWLDIDKTSYLSSETQVEMICNSDTAQCTLAQTNGIWNCKDTESLCFISDANISSATPWPLTTDIMSTNHAENTICDGVNPCNTDIVCMEHDCRILCNSDSSCASKRIYGTKESRTLSVECNGVHSCKDSNIFGTDLLYLKVICNGYQSCVNVNIYGNNSGLLVIDCLHKDGSCGDMNVYCPMDHKGCIISNDGRQSHDVHTHLDLYAVYGFDDLDVSMYNAILINDDNSTNMMHCGDNYESFCKLNSTLFCECEYDVIEHQIRNYSGNGMASMDVMAVTISGGILLLMVGLIGFCMFCKNWKKCMFCKCTSYQAVAVAMEKSENSPKMDDIEMEQTDLMQNDKSNHNAIILEEDSDHGIAIAYDAKHAKICLYETV